MSTNQSTDDCADRFEELTRDVDVVLDEDLAALGRMPERRRIERYNRLKSDEEAFVREFSDECPGFLTDTERSRVLGRFRLARLFIAASFYAAEGESLPRALESDFVDVELQAVVDFERYKQFDALSESQIEEKIRRMDGEVYELVTEYTSTQIANVDELVGNSDVQQHLVERLLERYDKRRAKIRRGFFTYVETHGLEHAIGAIEEAVHTVNSAAAERQQVREELARSESGTPPDEGFDGQRRQLESRMHALERELADRTVDAEAIRSELDAIEERTGEIARTQDAVLTELNAQIEQTMNLESRIEATVEQLQEAKGRATQQTRDRVREDTTELVENELQSLQDQRKRIREERRRLEREREQIEAARDSLDERQETLESRLSTVAESRDGGDETAGIDGQTVVTTAMAKLLEMDYLGRFDISMHETRSIQRDSGPFEVPEGYWEGRNERHNSRSELVALLEDEDPGRYPANETSRYVITSSRYLGLDRQTEMIIEARVVADIDAYAANGFDTRPADLDDLLAVVNEAVAEAEAGECEYLLGIASPTGWTERVREQIQHDEFARTRYSRYVSVCLVDLQDGAVMYDESDAVASENADLFAPPVDAERVSDCVETVRTEYLTEVAAETVLLRELVDEYGYDPHVVKRAFNDLETAGVGKQLYVDELGLCLDPGS